MGLESGRSTCAFWLPSSSRFPKALKQALRKLSTSESRLSIRVSTLFLLHEDEWHPLVLAKLPERMAAGSRLKMSDGMGDPEMWGDWDFLLEPEKAGDGLE